MKTQKELIQMYSEILKNEIWKKDNKMVDYCIKKTAYIVELQNGDIITIEKPKIETRFCFGYSDSRYDTKDYDDANNMAFYARKSEDYFIEQNIKGINQTIESLKGNEESRTVCYIRTQYYNQLDNSKLKSLQWFYWYDENVKDYKKLEGIDLQNVIKGYEIVKADFEKRLKSYLKRYGMSKVHTWSYWRDE